MKFNKSALVALVASAVLLSACDDKQNAQQPAAAQPATQQETAKNTDVTIESLVTITSTKRTIHNDGNPRIDISYEIENLSEKGIKAIHWQGYTLADNKVISLTDSTFPFEKPLLPKAKYSVIVTTYVSALNEQNRAVASNPETKVDLKTRILDVEFADGARVIVK